MRVRYGELAEAEQRELEALEGRAAVAYARVAARELDAPALAACIREIHPGLRGERGAGGELLIRASTRTLVPLAERVVALAPNGLEPRSHRPARGTADVLRELPRLGNADFTRARVRAGFTRGHLLELVLALPGGTGSTAERTLTEHLVREIAGERRADDWIARVDAVPAPRGGPLRVVADAPPEPAGFAIGELELALDAAIAAVTASLPDQPLWAAGDGEWTLFELDPEPAGDDYPEKDDLVMAVTRVPELLKSFLEGAPFSSLRFSRHGEQFFQLKFESHGPPEARLRERERLERALDPLLSAERAGRVVGGGLGLRYSYLDLAIAAPEPAFALVRRVARAAKLGERSWLEPFDSDLRGEWLEVWPGAPAPPKPAAQ